MRTVYLERLGGNAQMEVGFGEPTGGKRVIVISLILVGLYSG